VNGDAAITPSVRVRKLPGHTLHLQGIFVEAAGETILFPSDLVPTVAHLPFPWVMGYDLFPLTTLETKVRTLTEAAERSWILVFQHEPHHAVGRIRLEQGRPRFVPGP
jgi:glyoxylase-like metal-dependent hydrolase (beta-lactamase superfamily II)